MPSRYFATVLRAISIPSSARRATILSSDSGILGRSAAIILRMRACTAVAEKASPPSAAWIAELNSARISITPRSQATNLPAVTRLIVDSCKPSRSATERWVSGRSASGPRSKKPS